MAYTRRTGVLRGALCSIFAFLFLTSCGVDRVREQFTLEPNIEISSDIAAVRGLSRDQLLNSIDIPKVRVPVREFPRGSRTTELHTSIRSERIEKFNSEMVANSGTYEQCALGADGDPFKLHYCIREELIRQNDAVRKLSLAIQTAITEAELRLQTIPAYARPESRRFGASRLVLNALRSQTSSIAESAAIIDKSLVNFRYLLGDDSYNSQSDVYNRVYADVYYRFLHEIEQNKKIVTQVAVSFAKTRQSVIEDVCRLWSAEGPVILTRKSSKDSFAGIDVHIVFRHGIRTPFSG